MKLKLSILTSMIYASAALSCADNPDPFQVFRPNKGDTAMKSCWHAINKPAKCNKPEIKANCPLSCNICSLPCEDSTEIFEVNRPNKGDTISKSCWHAINKPATCNKPEMKANCPLSCNTCSLPCEDSKVSFEVNRPNKGDTVMKSCRDARRNPSAQCAKPEMKANCPATCKTCPIVLN